MAPTLAALLFAPSALAVAAVSSEARRLGERATLTLLVAVVLGLLGGLIGLTLYVVVTVGLHDAPRVTCGLALLLVLGVAIDVGRRFRLVPPAPEASEAPEEDDDGGGGPPRPDPAPRDPGPDGDLAPDWDRFDAERETWARPGDRTGDRDRELVPA